MQLAISCRIAEGFLSKEEATLSFAELADLAVTAGYSAICMRASQVGVHSHPADIRAARRILDERNLQCSMVTGDFNIVYNNERGPDCLKKIEPHLNLAEELGASRIRVCLKMPDDIRFAQQAADLAAQRGMTLLHQCHICSLFETVEQIENTLRKIDRENFRLIFEAANLEQCDQPYGEGTISRLAPWIDNVYLQNQRICTDGAITLETWCRGPVTFDVCEINGSEGIDFSSIAKSLLDSGYRGPVTVHQSAPTEPGLSATESAQQTADFLRLQFANSGA